MGSRHSALKALRKRLMRGEDVELKAVGFSPKPRVVTVEISYGGLDRVRMAGRTLTGERYASTRSCRPLSISSSTSPMRISG